MPHDNAFKTMFGGMVEARQRQANRYVADYLLSLDDAALKRAGYSRAKLRAGRAPFEAEL